MYGCMDATNTLKDQASHTIQRSRDGSSHPQYQSCILVDYGLHLINTQVPLILTVHEPAQSSLISTIHFGGLGFTPYQHPGSIDIKVV